MYIAQTLAVSSNSLMITLGIRLTNITYRACGAHMLYPSINLTKLGEIIVAAIASLFPSRILEEEPGNLVYMNHLKGK